MSPRLDLPIAAAGWLLGFAWVGRTGSWTPLAAFAVLAAARLLVGDPGTRRLLRPSAAGLALGAVGGLALVGATLGLYPLLARAFPALPGATRHLYLVLNSGGHPPFSLAALVLLLSACEELLWRGRPLAAADLGPLDRRGLARVAAVALLYGAATLASGSLLLSAVAAGCGLVWGLLRTAGRSLWPAILAHATWNLAVLVAWPLA